MSIYLIIATSIIVVVIVLCTVWTTWWLRRNSIKIMMEIDDESEHNAGNLETLNTQIIKTNDLLKTYNNLEISNHWEHDSNINRAHIHK